MKKLDYKYVLQEDCVVLIKCPYCGEELWTDVQEEFTECLCGHKYSSYIYVIEQENGQ